MDGIFKYFIFQLFFIHILNGILLKFVLKAPNDSESSLDQVLTWQQTEDRPLPKPTMTHYLHHQASGS